MSLPILKSEDKDLMLMQTQWSTQLNPVIAFPPVQGTILQNVSLVSGANVVNHKLGRKLQGWMLTRIRSSATIYDTQDNNTMPQLTLQLNASAAVVVDILVF